MKGTESQKDLCLGNNHLPSLTPTNCFLKIDLKLLYPWGDKFIVQVIDQLKENNRAWQIITQEEICSSIVQLQAHSIWSLLSHKIILVILQSAIGFIKVRVRWLATCLPNTQMLQCEILLLISLALQPISLTELS
jgi:hypothetical protein